MARAPVEIKIRQAEKKEASQLSNITYRSKGYWGYDEEFLRDCGELLNIKGSYIEQNIVFVAEYADKIAGFYGISLDEPDIAEHRHEPILVYLHVDPPLIGHGFGRLLWHHAIETATKQDWPYLKIHSDPNAEQFFLHMGAVHISQRPSRFRENRFIPILEYKLK